MVVIGPLLPVVPLSIWAASPPPAGHVTARPSRSACIRPICEIRDICGYHFRLMYPMLCDSARLPAWLAIVIVTLAACARAPHPSAIDRLHPCADGEGVTDAYCGSLTVFENRQARAGRTIDLRIVLLPADASDARPDPIFFLAGGPGQGAAKMARLVRELFRRLEDTRDIVLVDQRGTGQSHPLECASDDDSLQAINEPDETAFARLRACLAGYDADPRLYTTPVAMDDLDDVRAYLGYETINLYGGSYGTRAALAYLRQHEARVRAVVLDGVAPTDMKLPLFFGRDAQRALDRLLADCEADEACRARYPDLASRLTALLARLDRSPSRVRLVHPRTGIAEGVTVDPRFVASVLAGALYSPLVSSLLPEIVARAAAGDFQGMLALALVGESAEENMSVGMQLSVLCAEDYPRITPEEAQRQSAGTLFARYLLASRMKACEFWPKGDVAPSYYEPVSSSVPALVLSGDLDPVTPPSWGQSVAEHLQRSRHLVAPGTGHGVIGTGCGARLVREFIELGSADGLDTSCLSALRRPPFFLTPAGPDPAAGAKKATP